MIVSVLHTNCYRIRERHAFPTFAKMRAKAVYVFLIGQKHIVRHILRKKWLTRRLIAFAVRCRQFGPSL
jgi:hypothetical protein